MAGHKSFISFGAPSRLNPWESMWGAVAAVCGSAGLFVCLSLERAESRWEKKRSQSELWMGDTRPKVYAHLCFFRLDSKLGSSALVCQNKPRHFGHSTTPPLHFSTAPPVAQHHRTTRIHSMQLTCGVIIGEWPSHQIARRSQVTRRKTRLEI